MGMMILALLAGCVTAGADTAQARTHTVLIGASHEGQQEQDAQYVHRASRLPCGFVAVKFGNHVRGPGLGLS